MGWRSFASRGAPFSHGAARRDKLHREEVPGQLRALGERVRSPGPGSEPRAPGLRAGARPGALGRDLDSGALGCGPEAVGDVRRSSSANIPHGFRPGVIAEHPGDNAKGRGLPPPGSRASGLPGSRAGRPEASSRSSLARSEAPCEMGCRGSRSRATPRLEGHPARCVIAARCETWDAAAHEVAPPYFHTSRGD